MGCIPARTGETDPARSEQSHFSFFPDLTMSFENKNAVPNQKEIEKLAKYVL